VSEFLKSQQIAEERAKAAQKLKSLKFLIVEDQPTSRATLRQCAVTAGAMSVDMAVDYADALARIRSRGYDVVLCDYLLGEGRTGQQLLEEVLRRELLPEGVIWMMVTAERTYERVVTAVELAPADYILKPFSAELLLTRLGRILDKVTFLQDYYKLDKKKVRERLEVLLGLHRHSNFARYQTDVMRLEAENLVRAEMFDEAIIAYEHIMEEIHPFPWASVGKARVLLIKERAREAEHILDAVQKEVPDYMEAKDLYCQALQMQGKSQLAQRFISEVVRRTPNNFKRKRALLNLALENGDMATAEAVSADVINNDVIGICPDDFIVGARIKVQLGNLDSAKEILARVSPQDVMSMPPLQQMAMHAISAQTGNIDALAMLDATLDVDSFSDAPPEQVLDMINALLKTNESLADNLTARLMGSESRTRPVFQRLLKGYAAMGRENVLREIQRQAIVSRMGAKKRESH
jgi:DNA-binding response OmpR family regulator